MFNPKTHAKETLYNIKLEGQTTQCFIKKEASFSKIRVICPQNVFLKLKLKIKIL